MNRDSYELYLMFKDQSESVNMSDRQFAAFFESDNREKKL